MIAMLTTLLTSVLKITVFDSHWVSVLLTIMITVRLVTTRPSAWLHHVYHRCYSVKFFYQITTTIHLGTKLFEYAFIQRGNKLSSSLYVCFVLNSMKH